MILESGRVARLEGHFAWVVCESRTDCARCAEGKGCGGGLLGRWLGNRLHEVRAVAGADDLAPGDRVLLGLPETALLAGAAVVYLAPLLVFLAGAVVGGWLGGEAADGAQIIGAVIGLGLGLAWVRVYSRRVALDSRFQPRVVRRIEPCRAPSPAGCVAPGG